MNRTTVLGGALTVALAATLVQGPAYAVDDFPITVTPAEAAPGEPITVTGDATDPVCADDGVVVTFIYTKPDGTTGSTTANTVADAAGHFSAGLNVPATAVAGAPASVSAVIADCTPPGGPTSNRASENEAFEVLAYEGTFTVSKTSAKPGETVTFSGTNCWGGDVAVYLADVEIEGVTLNPDKTFSGSFTVPNAPGGVYELGAECPGTDYEVKAFTLVNPVSVAPPATPVPGRPRFTG